MAMMRKRRRERAGSSKVSNCRTLFELAVKSRLLN